MDTSPEEALTAARRLILEHGWNATAYQILNPGIQRWFTSSADGVVGYVEHSGHWVVAGSPICSRDRLPEVVEELERAGRRARRRICYFAADERLAKVLAARGPWDRLYLGAQPCWDPRGWSEILERKGSLRAQLNRARNKGVTVEEWSPKRARGHEGLKRILAQWLSTRGLPTLHFLVEPQTLARLFDRRIFVALRAGEPVAFLVLTPIPQRKGWLVEQNVRGVLSWRGRSWKGRSLSELPLDGASAESDNGTPNEAPNGTTELLIDAAMNAAAAEGSEYLTLGLSPLSQRARSAQGARLGSPDQPLWIRFLMGWTRAHGRRFYDFDGLDAYKAKFMPHSWEPIYAITSDRRVGLKTLWAVAAAFGNMAPPFLLARALGRALHQEARWLREAR